ncbi:fibrinogen-like protein A isoform X5 [Mytilus californianus]|uniref:fibrinogen-like protein A isoform X4 n=1 Tax=Mytilus californianus TaxID=6549 RepID=UPI0022456C69|nr:fibrinogen-like protein A isoform X4 [Mytilus californianus]XP_052086284.1 fibrinogen-like protein A isoform X5 [Mytilus californianus]
MHWILLCALFLAVNCSIETGNIEVRNTRKSSEEDSRVDDILLELQGICLTERNDKTAKELKRDTQTILSNMAVYKDIVKLNAQLKTEIKWILKESRGEKQVSRILRLIKQDVKGICGMKLTKDCTELKKYKSESGVYKIYPDKSEVKVYCDMTTDAGGWTIIQRRLDGSVDFQRTWTDYEYGFGNLNGEYWLGNKHIHSLTSSDRYELRIDLKDSSNTKKYALYKTFMIGDAASKYKLTIGSYSGNAGDNMAYHNGMKFSTTDQDNDESGGVCVTTGGPWWHKSCKYSGLNGKFNNMYWYKISSNIAKTSVMMIRKL